MVAKIYRDTDGTWCSKGSAYGVRLRRRFAGRTKKQAQEELDVLVEAARKRRLHAPARKKRTFEEAVKGYMRDGGGHKGMAKAADYFGDWDVADITPADVREFARDTYVGCKGSTLNSMGITPVRAVVNWAHQQGWCGALKVKQFETEKPKRRAVDGEWTEAMGDAAEVFEDLRTRAVGVMAMLMATTACRIGECVRIRWGDVDEIEMVIDLGKTKNGKEYLVPIDEELLEAMETLRGDRGAKDTVFGFDTKHQVYHHWRKVAEAAGVDYVPPHQAGRHTFATVLHNEHGWSANDIAEAGRWESVALVQRVYIHSDKSGRDALGAMRRRGKEGGKELE